MERNLVSVKGFISAIELLGFDEEDAELAGRVLAELEAEGRCSRPFYWMHCCE